MNEMKKRLKQRIKHIFLCLCCPGQRRELSVSRVYRTEDGYDAQRYWSDRLAAYRKSFRGVGNITLSEDANIAQYAKAVEVLSNLFHTVGFNPAQKSMLDIGCGNGFWSGVFEEWGVKRYTGVDITDVMFDSLQKRHPHFQYIAGNFLTMQLEFSYDLISMIDVTQHITSDKQLVQMLQRIRSLLSPDGIFIVTFWDAVRESSAFYEVFRPFSFYTEALSGLAHIRPMPFRDKFVAAFNVPGRVIEETRVASLGKDQITRAVQRIVSSE